MKSKIVKKLLTAVLGACMVLGAAACSNHDNPPDFSAGNKGSSADADNNQTGSTSGDKNIAKPASISWWTHDGLNKENGAEEWFVEFEKFTGIHLDHQFISNNEYYIKLGLAFASKEIPEVFDLNGSNLARYASQGAIRDLTDLVRNADFYDKVDPAIWEAIAIDGKIYAVPEEVPSAVVTYVRGDWLERLGMDVPATYEEFLEMLRRFKDEIPECEICLTAPGVGSERGLPEFYQGAHFGFAKVNGEWIDGFAQPDMAAAMQRMQDAYREGLLDRQIITNTTTTCRDAWYEGKVGVFTYWSGKWGGTLQEKLEANNAGAIAQPIEPIQEATYYFSPPGGYCISSQVSDKKAEQIFEYFFEYMHDGGQGQVLFQSGVEGVHWEQDGDMIKPLPNLADGATVTTSAWITPWMAISPLEVTDKKIKQADAVVNSLAVTDKYAKQVAITPVSDALNRISSDLDRAKSSILARVVMGEMTVDAAVEEYRKVAEELNVAQVLKELNGSGY